MKKVNRVIALGLAGALVVTANSSIAAPVLTNTAAVKAAVPDDLSQVRWGWGWGWGLGAFIGGLALGAALATPSYAYYGYPYGYGGGYPYTYGYWGGGYPYQGYRTAYWGGYPGWGYRRAYWGGGWGVRRAFWGGWGIRRSWWASVRSTRFAGAHRSVLSRTKGGAFGTPHIAPAPDTPLIAYASRMRPPALASNTPRIASA